MQRESRSLKVLKDYEDVALALEKPSHKNATKSAG